MKAFWSEYGEDVKASIALVALIALWVVIL